VANVQTGYGTAAARPIGHTAPAALRALRPGRAFRADRGLELAGGHHVELPEDLRAHDEVLRMSREQFDSLLPRT
jgi:hypothetical protein